MIEELIQIIQQNIHTAPYLIFGLLLLAGFNIPVSEDLMLFTSAMLAIKNPEFTTQLFIGVFLGAYLSDLICYGLGRFLGPKLWEINFFSKMISQEKVSQVTSYYDKYGTLTLIIGRFIPFGVRNGLFLTAGLGRMNFLKFALSDLLAATISCSTFFYLYFNYGESVIDGIKKFNVIIFSVAAIIVSIILIRKYLLSRKKS